MTSVTASPHNSSVSKKSLLAAIALRLLLMPLALHGDLIFIQYFPWNWSYRGIPDIYGYFADTFLKQGFTYYPPLVFWVTGLWQIITKPLMGGFDGWMERADHLMRSHASGGMADYTQGFAVADLVRWVVVLKLLYFAADALCWCFIRMIAKKDPRFGRLETVWLFHPVLLFSVYLFGQYRILPALVIWASAALFLRVRKYWAALIFGAVLLLDNFGFLILVPTLLIWGDGWRDRARLTLTALALPALILIPWVVISNGFVLACYFSPVVQKASMQGIFRSMTPEAAWVLKGLFALMWASTVWLSWNTRTKTAEDRLVLWAVATGSVLLALYATSTTMIHYFMWVLPFWLLLRVRGLLSPRWLGPAAIALLFLFNLDSREMNMGLLSYLHPVFADAPSLHEILSRWLPWGKCIALARLAFTVICLYSVFLFQKILFEHQKNRGF